jgi:hypothetical protein
MARVNKKGKGSGGIQAPTQRRKKEMIAKKAHDRKMDHLRKNS